MIQLAYLSQARTRPIPHPRHPPHRRHLQHLRHLRHLRHPRHRAAGMAVISALLVVAAAAVIATSMLTRQTTQVRLLESERARVQARALLIGGIDWARVILRADARRNATTRGDQVWATPITNMRVSEEGDATEAVFSGRVEDELGKFNLQNLARNGQTDPEHIAAFTRLLQSLGLTTQAVDAIAQRVALAQVIKTEDNASSAARAPGLHALSDLRSFGWDDQTIESLRPFLTILPVRTPLNLNTITAEVLAATLKDVSLAQALALIDQRDRGQFFNNAADFKNRLNSPDIDVDDSALAVTSAWFSVVGTVRIDTANVEMQALLRRDGESIPTVIWMRETQ